jgi:3'-phosphoadenosine 5'-phosphosulfate sulfotransferase (PAPS reductase)/FAD synthetase
VIICWWSGGVTSAVACKLAIDIYGIDKCEFVFIDTKNEDDDTYRFMQDCEKLYGKKIESISSENYESIQECWEKHLSLNIAKGAICSYKLKRLVREKWEKGKKFKHQVFGFDINENKRALALKLNHAQTKPIFPLLMYGLAKTDCITMLAGYGLEIPRVYKLGYQNNNCFKTGCVQGGIGYWQKIQREYPDKFDAMAKIEHDLTDKKGSPVTMLKDQSNDAKINNNQLLFLKPHSNYPSIKDISMIKGREPKPLFECNGLCGINELEEKQETNYELNF